MQKPKLMLGSKIVQIALDPTNPNPKPEISRTLKLPQSTWKVRLKMEICIAWGSTDSPKLGFGGLGSWTLGFISLRDKVWSFQWFYRGFIRVLQEFYRGIQGFIGVIIGIRDFRV